MKKNFVFMRVLVLLVQIRKAQCAYDKAKGSGSYADFMTCMNKLKYLTTAYETLVREYTNYKWL